MKLKLPQKDLDKLFSTRSTVLGKEPLLYKELTLSTNSLWKSYTLLSSNWTTLEKIYHLIQKSSHYFDECPDIVKEDANLHRSHHAYEKNPYWKILIYQGEHGDVMALCPYCIQNLTAWEKSPTDELFECAILNIRLRQVTRFYQGVGVSDAFKLKRAQNDEFINRLENQGFLAKVKGKGIINGY